MDAGLDRDTLDLVLEVEEGVAKGTVIENVATVSASDNSQDSDSASVTVQPPMIMVNKIGTPSPIEPGGILNYQVIGYYL